MDLTPKEKFELEIESQARKNRTERIRRDLRFAEIFWGVVTVIGAIWFGILRTPLSTFEDDPLYKLWSYVFGITLIGFVFAIPIAIIFMVIYIRKKRK